MKKNYHTIADFVVLLPYWDKRQHQVLKNCKSTAGETLPAASILAIHTRSKYLEFQM
jgi:hypothetical protein